MEGMTLDGRVAVVTGGAGGIGSQICRDLADLGARLVVVDIDEAGADKVAEELPDATAAPVDLEDPASIDDLTVHINNAVGRVDVLVNNAGWDYVEPFIESEPATWDRLLAINLRAPVQLTHALLPAMIDRQWGRLVFVSSDAARVGSTGEAVYSACKAGLIGFAKTIARESARASVTSNVVCPGPSDTPLLQQIGADRPGLVEALKKSIPLRRLGRPSDIAGMVAFLASERAAFITGQTVSVSGGLTMV